MRLHELEPRRLREAVDPDSPVGRFLDEFHATTQENWLNPRQRLVAGVAGVIVYPSVDDRRNGIHLSDIVSGDVGQGHGSTALRFVTDLADKHGVTLDLVAKSYVRDRLTTKQLLGWYARHGFVKGRGNAQDGYEMVRPPKGAAAAPKPAPEPAAKPVEPAAKPVEPEGDGPVRIKLRGRTPRPH